jgi:hypothetical protein
MNKCVQIHVYENQFGLRGVIVEQYVCNHCSKVHRYSDGAIIDNRFYCNYCQERIAQESELAMRAYEDKVEEARQKGLSNKFCSEALQNS